jgi:hypothetical protein
VGSAFVGIRATLTALGYANLASGDFCWAPYAGRAGSPGGEFTAQLARSFPLLAPLGATG